MAQRKRGPKGPEVQSTTHEVQGTEIMEVKNEVQVNEDQQVDQGVVVEAGEAQSTEHVAQGATYDVQSEVIEPQPEGAETPAGTQLDEGAENQAAQGAMGDVPRAVVVPIGIGQFCRYLMLNSKKTNAEILELVHAHFKGAKTTAACIAWYKTDLRKKGLLPSGQAGRSGVKIVNLTAEELEQLTK